MNEEEKELVKYLKLDCGLQYQNGNFTHIEPLVENGQIKIEEYNEIFFYEPIEEKQISTWNTISEKIKILRNPQQCFINKSLLGCLQSTCDMISKKTQALISQKQDSMNDKSYIKLLIPIFKITYIGNPLDSFISDAKKSEKTELRQQFLAETILVGGGLIIKNIFDFKNKLELDLLKAHIIWTIDEIRSGRKHKKPFKKTSINELSKLYDLNDNPLCDLKQLDDYISQIFSYKEFSMIAYEKVIPAFMRLDKQLKEEFMSLHKIPKEISFEVVERLVPGISGFHQEQNLKDCLMKNININFLHWIKEYHLEYGLLVTPNGLVHSKEKVIEFLCEPKFDISEQTLLRISHVKNQMDLPPWTDKSDDNEKAISQIMPFISTDPQDSKIKAIACNIIQEQLKLQININENEVKISDQLKEDITKALSSNQPFIALTNVFKKYGYLFCKSYTFGNSLESISYSRMSTETKQESKSFKRPGLPNEQTDLITAWKNFQTKFNVKSFSDDHTIVKPEEIGIWLNNNNSEYAEAWHVVNRSRLITIWELLDSNIQEQIRKLFNTEQILMKGEEMIPNQIRYHRIKLDPPLRSNNYQVIGSIFTSNYEKMDQIVKFQLMDCDGFSAIIEEPNIGLYEVVDSPLILEDFDNQFNHIKVLTNSIKIDLNKWRDLKDIEIDITEKNEEFSSNCIIATSFKLSTMNFEPNFQVILKSWSKKKIKLEIVNHSYQEISEDNSAPISCSLVWHAIYVMQQEVVDSDNKLLQIPWMHLGHHLKPNLCVTRQDAIDQDRTSNEASSSSVVKKTIDSDPKPHGGSYNSIETTFETTSSIQTESYITLERLSRNLTIEIFTIYEKAEFNKKICSTLLIRVEIAHEAIKPLILLKNDDKIFRERCYNAFKKFVDVLEGVKRFISEVTQLSGFKRFFMASDVKEQFIRLTNEFDTAMKDLHFCIALMNYELNKRNYEKQNDFADLTEDFDIRIIQELELIKSQTSKSVQELELIKSQTSKSVQNECTPQISPKELQDPPFGRIEDRRGTKESFVIKKLYRHTMEVACKQASNSKENQTQLTIFKLLGEAPNILRFYGISYVDNCDVMVFEWAEMGNLKEFYEKFEISWCKKLQLALDICRGIIFLHDIQVFHRDIRCENVMITKNLDPKLTNFKHARMATWPETGFFRNMEIVRWLPPELMGNDRIKIEPYTHRCEIFSFGMLLWELCYERIPYIDIKYNDIISFVLNGGRERIPNEQEKDGIQVELARIITRTWEQDPMLRISGLSIFLKLQELSAKFIKDEEIYGLSKKSFIMMPPK
ncbi:22196_t:CDS:10, partial [Gigaspora margarita]